MATRRAGSRIAAGTVVALALALAGCGGGSEEDRPAGPFADALADPGGGGASGSLRVGWADPALVEDAGLRPGAIADARSLGGSLPELIGHGG